MIKWKRIIFNIIHWLLATVLFAVFPLFLYLLFRWIFQLKVNPTQQYIAELCSCTLTIIAADFVELTKDKYRKKKMRKHLTSLQVLLSLFFAMVYGVIYLFQLTGYLLLPQTMQKLFITVKIACASNFIFSFALQIIGGLL